MNRYHHVVLNIIQWIGSAVAVVGGLFAATTDPTSDFTHGAGQGAGLIVGAIGALTAWLTMRYKDKADERRVNLRAQLYDQRISAAEAKAKTAEERATAAETKQREAEGRINALEGKTRQITINSARTGSATAKAEVAIEKANLATTKAETALAAIKELAATGTLSMPEPVHKKEGEKWLLLVEDDGRNAHAMTKLFGLQDYKVVHSPSVAEAKRHIYGEDNYDCIVIDLILPDGSGLEVIDAVHQAGSRARVVILTGSTNPALAEQARAFHPHAFLVKPINPQLLINAVHLESQPEPAEDVQEVIDDPREGITPEGGSQ